MNELLIILGFIFLNLYHLLTSLLLVFVPRRFRRVKDVGGQSVLITGAGSGVGRQLAIEFSKHSTCLILLDIDKPSLLVTEKLLDRQSTVFLYQCDVSKPEMVYQVTDRIKKEAGGVDILVNNAGIVSGMPLLELPEEKIVKTMEVNVLAHFWTCKAFLPAMLEKNRGHIVSVASIAGKMGGPRLSDYCASKFAAVGFAEALETELREQKKTGIKVTIVCPSYIDTGLFKGMEVRITDVMSPEYVAREILQAILEEKEIIYLPHWLQYVFMLREFVPRWISLWAFEKSGDIRAMENFTGRNGANDITDTKPKKLE